MRSQVASGSFAALKRNSFVSEILGKIAASDMKGVFCMMYMEKPITCN